MLKHNLDKNNSMSINLLSQEVSKFQQNHELVEIKAIKLSEKHNQELLNLAYEDYLRVENQGLFQGTPVEFNQTESQLMYNYTPRFRN